jgi:hypothetical protein
MAFGLDASEDFFDLAILADNECRARYADHLLTVHVLLFEDAVRVGNLLIDIAQQRKRQFMLFLEAGLRTRRVGRDAQHYCALLVELLDGVTKLVSFRGSAGSVGARKKIEDNLLAFELGELKGLISVGLKLDFGSFVAFFEHLDSFQFFSELLRG